MGGPRALDHLVLPCADLAGAATMFAALGFLVGRRNRHPWGTENHIVQVPGAFIELIALAADATPPVPADDAFPFAGFLAGLAGSARPSGMIVLRSEDAAADARAFAAAGIGAGRTLHFSREGMAPDGGTRTVAFTLAFADAADMPDIGAFVCQQHRPENFWNPAMQRHPNGVVGIAGITIGARNPSGAAAFLSRFAGQPAVGADAASIALAEATTIVVERAEAGDAIAAIRFRGGDASRTARFGDIALVFG